MLELVLFDVDGVLLSEERYFDGSALAVWELLYSPRYLGLEGSFTANPSEEQIRVVREKVFLNDKILHALKGKGVNSNWDMVYLSFSYQLLRGLQEFSSHDRAQVRSWLESPIDGKILPEIGGRLRDIGFQPDFPTFLDTLQNTDAVQHQLLRALNDWAREWTGVPTEQFGRTSALWSVTMHVFQEWYLGAEHYRERYGEAPREEKRGFLYDEIPIRPAEEIREILEWLRDRELLLGMGTGRPRMETRIPLSALQLLDTFEPNRIVTADDVLEAENAAPQYAPLAKPHPFTYLRAIVPDEPALRLLRRPLPLTGADRILIVGDSLADWLAAGKIGCRFAATLTGLSGQEARASFEKRGVRWIVDDVTQLPDVLRGLLNR
ncbi:MAG: HAD family hydrolase [Kyrpidia tusciae]|nr:HAD hydrolase-like protein [Kyrpidia tusciae]MBE3551488.1 HAD family hydrolase [Kyrpidia tusciae]